MSKKKPTKKKATKKPSKPKPPEVMSKGFGHLTIKKNWIVRDGATVDGGEVDWEGWSD